MRFTNVSKDDAILDHECEESLLHLCNRDPSDKPSNNPSSNNPAHNPSDDPNQKSRTTNDASSSTNNTLPDKAADPSLTYIQNTYNKDEDDAPQSRKKLTVSIDSNPCRWRKQIHTGQPSPKC